MMGARVQPLDECPHHCWTSDRRTLRSQSSRLSLVTAVTGGWTVMMGALVQPPVTRHESLSSSLSLVTNHSRPACHSSRIDASGETTRTACLPRRPAPAPPSRPRVLARAHRRCVAVTRICLCGCCGSEATRRLLETPQLLPVCSRGHTFQDRRCVGPRPCSGRLL